MNPRPTPFIVDGKPFFPLGGQVHNSSAFSLDTMDTAWQALAALHANMVELPVYWEQVEPTESVYDFQLVDALLDEARQRGLKVIVLWFATWKNGTMKNAPSWVKADTVRFDRVQTRDGVQLGVLSPLCSHTRDADRRALCALLEHLHERDRITRTVIAVQIENEPGILGSDRDYSEAASELFAGPLPALLVDAMHAQPTAPLAQQWHATGANADSSWSESFGRYAGEVFTAWHIARFINDLAEAGKAIYALPMYTNVWLDNMRWRIPGANYPAGGAVTTMLDVWKWAAPALDLIAPDVYARDAQGYAASCRAYDRPDNPLFVPESACHESNGLNVFGALAQHNTVGYAVFGVEDIIAPDGAVRAEHQLLVDSFRSAAAALPLIMAYGGTDKLRAVVQEEYLSEHLLDFGAYLGLVLFQQDELEFAWTDFRHYFQPRKERGRGLIAHVTERELFLVGGGYRVLFKPKLAVHALLAAAHASEYLACRLATYFLVEEGHWDAAGKWHVDRKRSGDESDFGVWVHPDVGVVRVVLGD